MNVTAKRGNGGFQNRRSCDASCSVAPSDRVAPRLRRSVVVRWVFVSADITQPVNVAPYLGVVTCQARRNSDPQGHHYIHDCDEASADIVSPQYVREQRSDSAIVCTCVEEGKARTGKF